MRDEVVKRLMEIYIDKSKGWEYNVADDDEEVEADTFWDEAEDDEELVNGEKFAIILMDELTENNLDSHIILKYPKIADWWGGVLKERKRKEDARIKREEAKRQKEEDARAKAELLSRLTPEERRLLGIK